MNCKSVLGIIALLSLVLVGLSEGSECENRRKLDLMLVIDGTLSLGYRRFDNIKLLLQNVVAKLDIRPEGVHVGMIQFSDRWGTKIEKKLGQHGGVDNVLSDLERMRYQQGYYTLTGLAFEMARKQFFGKRGKGRDGVDKVLLLITDGKPMDLKKLRKEEKILKEKRVRIVTVSVGGSRRRIQRYKYLVRSIASGFKQSFSVQHKHLLRYVDRIAEEVCSRNKATSPGRELPRQKCFQEKKDIVFAVDGSSQISKEMFQDVISFLIKVTGNLDITPSLIHVGLVQYSDAMNTRIEFSLNQYTNALHVNESLKNVVYSKGKNADLIAALNVIETEIFIGSGGDRISADDFLLLFENGKAKNSDAVLKKIQGLKDKGVHVMVIGLGKTNVETRDYYEELASHPNDAHDFDTVEVKHVIGDLAATTCVSVLCNTDDEKSEKQCKQEKQDILFMIDMSMGMKDYYDRANKFFRKVVGKLNLAATNTHVGFLTFSSKYRTKIQFEIGKYRFGHDIIRRMTHVKLRRTPSNIVDIGNALKIVNTQIFTTPTGGHRVNASDFIFMATIGNTINRPEVKRQVSLLRRKGVRIAILNVAPKNPVRRFQNIIHDIVSGPREVFPLDFKRVSVTTQDILHIKCSVDEAIASQQCFQGSRKVMFLLDSSRRLRPRQVPNVLEFIAQITEKLYVEPSNIAVGLAQYGDFMMARTEFAVESRPLNETLYAIRNLEYQYGANNFVGDALEFIGNEKFTDDIPSVKKVVVLLTHSKPSDPQKAFRMAERLKRKGVELITIAIHMEKRSTNINQQYKALASSHASAHSYDLDGILTHVNDIVLNVCDLHACPKDFTKDCTPKKQDIFMIIDSSRSIGRRIYPELKRFVRRFVGNLDVSPERTKLGILQASDSSSTQYEMMLSEYTDAREVESIINDMNYHNGGASFIGNAIEMAITDNLFNGSGIDRPDAENVLMIFTDGVFHDERLALRLINKLKKNGVRVVAIGLGQRSQRRVAKKLLKSVASSKSDVYLISLSNNALLVEAELNEVVRHVQTLECIDKYRAPIRCSPETVDLFVAVDGSRSVGWVNYGKVQEFLKKLASEFDIGKKKAHFGILQFGAKDKTRLEFNMDAYGSNEEVNSAIGNMTFLDSQATYTGHSLWWVNNKIFNGQSGDRPNIPNILILFTDGAAHDFSTAQKNAAELKKRGTRIIGIAAGSKVDTFFYQLKELVSRPEDAHKTEFDQLSGIVDDLLDVVCKSEE